MPSEKQPGDQQQVAEIPCILLAHPIFRSIDQHDDHHSRYLRIGEGIAVDPVGPRLDQIHRVFSDLTAVAHRQHLPWEIHLVRHQRVKRDTTRVPMRSLR